eukprot:g33282.t1
MDGSIKRLFEGEMENYIECLDVDYTSKRTETFYDLQLNIKSEKGHDLLSIEDGAEGFGKQRAKKGIRFMAFPPVLNLQLKRFHFDMERMDMVKLNSRFEFPRKLDLSQFAPGAGHYLLHSVVVHSGDVNSGHYYAYIRPNLDEHWVKFDDDVVTPCSDYAAVEDNFGGSDLNTCNYFDRFPSELRHFQWPTRPRIHNAYMLVYIREDSAEEVLRIPDPLQVNRRMVDRCNAEVRLLEQRRREKVELQNKIRRKGTILSGAGLASFTRTDRAEVLDSNRAPDTRCSMTGFWDHNIPTRHSLEMNRDQQVAQYMEVRSAKHVALFALHYRVQNRTVRFDYMPLQRSLRSQMPQVTSPHYDSANPSLTVLCVASLGYELTPPPMRLSVPPEDNVDDLSRWDEETVIMLVVKYFCVQTRKIITLGCAYMNSTTPLIDMVRDGWVQDRLQIFEDQVAPLPPNMKKDSGEERRGVRRSDPLLSWECWEEYSEREMQMRTAKKSPKSERLWCGDVVVWQQNSAPELTTEAELVRAGQVAPTYPVNNVSDLAEHQLNAIDVQVTLMDSKQPLCIDGVVMNGHWGPYRRRPRSGDTGCAELHMDLRWSHNHVVGVIAEAFNLRNVATLASPAPEKETFLWPGTQKRSQMSLCLEMQRHAPYVPASAGKKPLSVHVVEMPFRPGADGCDPNWAFGVRFFDSAVREVGSAMCILNFNSTIQPEWKISGPLRAMEVIDGLATLYRTTDLLRNLQCSAKLNILYHAIRVEADLDTESIYPSFEKDVLPTRRQHPDSILTFNHSGSAVTCQDDHLIEVYHCDRSSQQAFGQPFFLPAAPGEKVGSFKNRCKEKLGVPENEFKSWRLVRIGQRSGRQHLKDDETLESENGLEVRTAKSGLLCFFGRSFPCVFEWGVREGKNGRSGGS